MMNTVYYTLEHRKKHDEELYTSLVDHRLHPKFLYSTAHSASVYEAILTDPQACPKHRKNNEYGKFICKYLSQHIPEFKRSSPLGIVSLGVGIGDIEASFIEEHYDQQLFHHIFVDYSLYFLEKTVQRVKTIHPKFQCSVIHADFSREQNTVLINTLRNIPKQQKVFLLTGEIFSKYHPTKLLSTILELMSPKDYLFIDMNIFPSDPGIWLTMVKNQILKFNHQEYYFERICSLGFDRESTHLEFQLQDELYNSYWNVYTRLLTFTAPQPIQVGSDYFTLYPGDTFSFTKYHYFKEKFVLDYFHKFPVRVIHFTAPLIKQPHNPLRWCLLQKT